MRKSETMGVDYVKLLDQELERRTDLRRIQQLAELLLQRIETLLQQEASLTAEEISDLAEALSYYWEIRQGLEREPGIWKNGK
jgi:hypothetical protein